MMKRFAEKVSQQMGYGGEINPTVLKEAQRKLYDLTPPGACGYVTKEKQEQLNLAGEISVLINHIDI